MIQEHEGSRHVGLKIFVLICALMIIALPAMAARGGGGGGGGGKGHGGTTGGTSGSGSITLVLLDSTDGQAHYGSQVTFKVSGTDDDWPQVNLDCYKDGVWVYAASAGFFSSYPWSRNFTLATTSAWTSGAADCTATLYYTPGGGKSTAVASTGFHVYP